MRRPNGPTSKVIEFAREQPGGVITWSEAQGAYARGTVIDYRGVPVKAASHHKMSVSNVLRQHFNRVEGAQGMYVLRAMIDNPDWDEDQLAMRAFHDLYGADEFGMSVETSTAPWSPRLFQATEAFDVVASVARSAFSRMSNIGSDWSGASVSIVGGDFDGARGRTTLKEDT